MIVCRWNELKMSICDIHLHSELSHESMVRTSVLRSPRDAGGLYKNENNNLMVQFARQEHCPDGIWALSVDMLLSEPTI